MKEEEFRISVEGEGIEGPIKKLTEFIKDLNDQTGWRPAWTTPGSSQSNTKLEPISVAALILAVPSAVLATLDIIARRKKREKLDSIIAWAKKQKASITITYPDGTFVQLKNATSGQLLDAANKGK